MKRGKGLDGSPHSVFQSIAYIPEQIREFKSLIQDNPDAIRADEALQEELLTCCLQGRISLSHQVEKRLFPLTELGSSISFYKHIFVHKSPISDDIVLHIKHQQQNNPFLIVTLTYVLMFDFGWSKADGARVPRQRNQAIYWSIQRAAETIAIGTTPSHFKFSRVPGDANLEPFQVEAFEGQISRYANTLGMYETTFVQAVFLEGLISRPLLSTLSGKIAGHLVSFCDALPKVGAFWCLITCSIPKYNFRAGDAKERSYLSAHELNGQIFYSFGPENTENANNIMKALQGLKESRYETMVEELKTFPFPKPEADDAAQELYQMHQEAIATFTELARVLPQLVTQIEEAIVAGAATRNEAFLRKVIPDGIPDALLDGAGPAGV